MAQYVQKAKNILADVAPDFMDLNSICTPPINFVDALQKARESTVTEITRIVDKGRASDIDVVKAVEKNVKITLSYLVIQLHARGSQEFWNDTKMVKLGAYLIFRVIDQYADVLTHIQADGFNPAISLDSICSFEGLHKQLEFFNHLSMLVMRQRSLYSDDWYPTEVHCQSIMQQYAGHVEKLAVSGILTKVAIGASLASIALYALVKAYKKI